MYLYLLSSIHQRLAPLLTPAPTPALHHQVSSTLTNPPHHPLRPPLRLTRPNSRRLSPGPAPTTASPGGGCPSSAPTSALWWAWAYTFSWSSCTTQRPRSSPSRTSTRPRTLWLVSRPNPGLACGGTFNSRVDGITVSDSHLLNAYSIVFRTMMGGSIWDIPILRYLGLL